MKKLSDFEQLPTDIPNGVQTILEFGDYELSIIKSDFSYGGQQGLWEIGVFHNGEMVEVSGITNDGDTIKGYLNESEVNEIIEKMYDLSNVEPTQL